MFNSEVEIVASISEDQRAHIWDTRSGETIALDDHFLVRRIALGPDGSLLATVGVARSDGTAPFEPPNDIIRVWTGVSA